MARSTVCVKSIPTSRRQYRDHITKFVGRKPWHHFVTLTFRYRTSAHSAAAYFERWFVPNLSARTGREISSAGQVEAGPLTGRIHLHVLLFGTADMSIREIQSEWGAGITDIEPYNKAKRGLGYVTDEWYECTSVILLDDHRLRRAPRRRHNPARLARNLRRAMRHRVERANRLPNVADKMDDREDGLV